MLISEDVIRFMTVAVDELEDGQSAMLRRRDDREDRGSFGDDRGFGGGGFGGGFGGGGGYGGGGRGGAGGGRGRPREDRVEPVAEVL